MKFIAALKNENRSAENEIYNIDEDHASDRLFPGQEKSAYMHCLQPDKAAHECLLRRVFYPFDTGRAGDGKEFWIYPERAGDHVPHQHTVQPIRPILQEQVSPDFPIEG